MMALIDFEAVNLIRNQKQILKNINWKVESGENWAILGLNGSGKSSLIKLILAEEWKTSGRLEVLGSLFGRDEIPKLRQKISVVGSFIAERFNPNIKCLNLVYTGKFNSSMLYKPFTDGELDESRELLMKMGGAEFINRQYGSLSQGEKQLILIARSLILKPKLLILDEATNGLDLFARKKLIKRLNEISRLKDAPHLIYITHHPDEISELFGKILLLREGEIFRTGNRKELLRAPILSEFYQEPVTINCYEGNYFVVPKS